MRSLTSVDLPDPLGPRTATREDRDTWRVISWSCWTAVPGYWKATLRLKKQSIKVKIHGRIRYSHLEQTLFLSLDTFEHGRVWELKLVVLSGLESIVRFGLRNVLHKGLKVTTVAAQLEAVEVENIGDGVVKEGTVVRDND